MNSYRRFGLLGGGDNPPIGTFSTYCIVSRNQVIPTPTHLDDVHAAAWPVAGVTAWRPHSWRKINYLKGSIAITQTFSIKEDDLLISADSLPTQFAPTTPLMLYIFSYGFAAVFFVYVQFTDGPTVDIMAAKTVLRFMSLETGGVHPLATEPDIQLNTDLSVNLLNVRVDVIGGDQIMLVLVDLRIHNPESDAIYLAHRAPNMTYEDVLAVLSKDLVLFLKCDIPCLELCRVTTMSVEEDFVSVGDLLAKHRSLAFSRCTITIGPLALVPPNAHTSCLTLSIKIDPLHSRAAPSPLALSLSYRQTQVPQTPTPATLHSSELALVALALSRTSDDLPSKPPAAQNKAWAAWKAAGVSTNTSGSLTWSLTLEVSLRIPHIGNVLANILRRTKLTLFSLMPLVPLPDDIPCLLSPQTDLDRFVFMVPSVLTSSRTGKAVDDFFRRIGALGSGMMNMPNSTRSCDSGMFSGEGIDFTKIKKLTKKLKKRSVEEWLTMGSKADLQATGFYCAAPGQIASVILEGLENAEEGFELLARGEHVGKIVIRMDGSSTSVKR
ncbi:hypothetical protein F5888DRAFT_1807679 [Russula emetica]|nr:hypothetical protein F5888DRAFT_1807679 [Russula emetica]